MKKIGKVVVVFAALCVSTTVFSAEIHSVTSGRNADGNFEVQINGSGLNGVNSFSLNNPARIVVDIPDGRSNLSESVIDVRQAGVSEVAVIEGDDRVRTTINLSKMSPYRVIDTDSRISVVVQGKQVTTKKKKNKQQRKKVKRAVTSTVDFRRGVDAQGRVEISLPNDNVVVNVERRGRKVIANLRGSQFGHSRKLNVMDFGTPVKSIDIYKRRLAVLVANDNFDMVSYQNDNKFLIEFNKPEKQTIDQAALLPGDSKKKYTGEPLSLNFQDIEVRAVLQLIGDFTNTNIVVSDEVTGGITLRLNNVPWDQALDIILQTKGLSKQQNGDVIYIAPSGIIAKNKKEAYAVANVEKEVAPLQQQLIPIKFARAENIEKIIEDNSNRSAGSDGKRFDEGLLSSRGSVSVDKRTNTIIVNDVASSIDKVIALIERLDTAVNQVLIDSRIVTASNTFAHDIGIRWGGAFVGATDSLTFAGAGNAAGASTITTSANKNIAKTGQAFPVATPSLNNRLGVNLGAATKNAASLGLSVLGSDFLLDLELSALEDDGRGEVISSPRVITQDGHEAVIRQGKQYAYRKLDESGNTTIEFKDIDLKLKVTPKIAPNRSVDMILEIDKDSIASLSNTGEPLIDTNGVRTQVLVESGETIVLGGVYEQQKSKSVSKVPVLGDLPVVGRAFRKDHNEVKKSELLIFVTPKIIDKRYISNDKFSDIRN